MKTIKQYQVEVLHGNSIDLEDALLKKDVLGLIDELRGTFGLSKEEALKLLKARITG